MSVAQWLKAQETPRDVYRDKRRLHAILSGSLYELWQRAARKRESALNDPDYAELAALAETAEKRWRRVNNCQGEWVGYRADCCTHQTQPVAVPVGCNHRLCPLCAAHRSEMARKRIRAMFDRLTHPVLITLTIPNLEYIRKADFTQFRQKVGTFMRQHPWMMGGVYSLETTFNRTERTWHIHVHILADAETSLPRKEEKIDVFGKRICLFTFRKLSLEFDWLRLWTSGRGKKPRKDASAKSQVAEASQFREWIEATRSNSTRVFDVGTRRYVKRSDLELEELARREQWNRENRRVVDIRPVTDREGAAFEVLKYITKVSAFSDLPEAVEEFSEAVRGARLIQTFGTWYNVKLDGDANEHDWSELQCACGMNAWKRMGTFHYSDVEMDAAGRWHLKAGFDCDSKPTVKHPLIEAMARAAPKGEWEQTTFLVG